MPIWRIFADVRRHQKYCFSQVQNENEKYLLCIKLVRKYGAFIQGCKSVRENSRSSLYAIFFYVTP